MLKPQLIKHEVKKEADLVPWRQLLAPLLTVLSFSLILWAGWSIWRRPCRGETIILAGNGFCLSLLDDLSYIVVTLGFWGLSLLPWFSQRRFLPFLFFQMCGAVLATGILSFDGDVGSRLFNAVLAWFTPVAIHFHLHLLNRPLQRLEKWMLSFFYILAALVSLPFLAWTTTILEQVGYLSILRMSTRLGLLGSFVIAACFLISKYQRHASLETRGHIRLVSFGTIFAFTPMLLLSVLPDVLGAVVFVSYTFTFPGLLLSPLSYLFSIFRDRLSHLESTFNRFLIYYLSLSLLLSLYLVIIAVSDRFTEAKFALSMTNVWVSVGLLLCFPFVYNQLQRLIDWLLYGGEINYLALLTQFSEALSLTLDQATLTRLLVHDLVSALYLQGGIVFLQTSDKSLMLADATGFNLAADIFHQPWQNCPVLSYLEAEAKPILTFRLQQVLSHVPLCQTTRELLALPEVSFWIPLISNGVLQGVLLLSSRRSGDYLSAKDENILIALSHQAGIAAYNVKLMEQVVQSQQDLARAHQKLLRSREEERRRLAHELHGGSLQRLLGLSYRVVALRRQVSLGEPLDPQSLETVRTHLLDIVSQLRQMISGLYPAGLEELGLFAALDGYIARLKRTHTNDLPVIDYDLTGDETFLPDDVAICLFRVAQEAMCNTLKHAKATHVTLRIRLVCDQANLWFQDNGRGFQVPSQLSNLTQQDHFGLVGMSEQVEWVGGTVAIQSQPHTGTSIAVSIPLSAQTTAQEDSLALEEDRVCTHTHSASR